MVREITVPVLGESVTEATIARWLRQPGDVVRVDDPVVELETEKVTLEVNAPVGGVLGELLVNEGGTVQVGTVLVRLNDDGQAPAQATAPVAPAITPSIAAPNPAAATGGHPPMPAARKLIADAAVDAAAIAGTGRDGRVTKGDVLSALARPQAVAASLPATQAPTAGPPASRPRAEREERVRMTRLRQTIARRLKDAQNTAAMLTTFNEVDMSHLINLRASYKEKFEKRHGVKLGFMSFFVKAVIEGLKEVPAVNAEIDGTDLVYKNYYDIGVAVGTPQGLVVPVLRDADQFGFAEVEKRIADFGRRARDGQLRLEDMSGGTFTISNGGVYGSLLSTPILNPPQSAVLGMHKTQDRAVVIGGKVEVRPMMYLALSYDHRIIDGREAVTFLIRVKECVEDPERLLLSV